MYIYLASPYTDPNPSVQEARYLSVLEETARLISDGYPVFSPIAHCHPITTHYGLPGTYEFWKDYTRIMLAPARELYVLMLSGWRQSVGLTDEIDLAGVYGKPITYIEPGRGHEDNRDGQAGKEHGTEPE